MPKISEIPQWAESMPPPNPCYWCEKEVTAFEVWAWDDPNLIWDVADRRSVKFIFDADLHASCLKPLENFLRNV